MTLFWQNYFGDPWNVLDFVIVVGSIVDIIAAKALVSCLIASLRRVHVPYFVYYMCVVQCFYSMKQPPLTCMLLHVL